MVTKNYSRIRRQSIYANNFELKASLISMVQQQEFGGYPLKDPDEHISMFLELFDTIEMDRVLHDVIMFRLFLFLIEG